VSADKGRERLLPEERGHKLSEKPESILLADLASPGNCEDSFRETLSIGRLIPEADFTPLNGGSDRPLGGIVGWLDSLNAQKGKENVPVFEETGGACPDTCVGAFAVAQARAFHAAPDKGGSLPQLFAGATGFFEGMPVAEKRSGFL